MGVEPEDRSAAATVARNSASTAVWTMVGRVTGFLRITLIAAVLGPTFFGNLFQSANLLPNIVYEFMAGNLIIALLVPPLVHRLDRGDGEEFERLARGFLGVMLLAFTAAVVLAVALGPFIVRAFLLGVEDPEELARLTELGWVLLALVAPQLLLYGVAGSGVAVQHAHGRYRLAAAAPALENIVLSLVLVTYAVVFGLGSEVDDLSLAQVVLLGAGSTFAVAIHAGAQWWGARRVGCTLLPRAGWRDPEVRAVVRLAIPSVGYAGLNGIRLFGVLVVAGTVPGGTVAFALAINFFNLPVAIGGRSIAWAQVPRLARLHHRGEHSALFDEWRHGLAASLFLVVPAGIAYVALAEPLASAFAFGEMATPRGVTLITASLASVGLGVIGETTFIHGTQGFYALRDAGPPLRTMVLRTGVTATGMVLAVVAFDGVMALVVLGLTITAADLTTGALLSNRFRIAVARGRSWSFGPLLQAVAASLVMVIPAGLIAQGFPSLIGESRQGSIVGVVLAAVVGVGVYLALQRSWHSAELAWLRSSRAAPATLP